MRYKLRNQAAQAISLLCEPGFLRALVTWPLFSVTSFLMVSRLIKLGLRPQTIIDVGANVGQFGVSVAKSFPEATVHSYEPVPECYARLERTAAKLNNLKTYPIALGETGGELQFNVNSHSHSSSVLSLTQEHAKAFPFATEARTITVKVGTLDQEYGGKDLASPVLLKLDVQGYEAMVLNGAKNVLSQIDYVLVEMSFQPLYLGERPFQDMLRLLDELGFRFQQPVGFLSDQESGGYLQMDGLFARCKG